MMSLNNCPLLSVSDNLYFNGTGLVRYDLLREPIASLQDSIKFRFKTSFANGIILYSRGTQGDYIALQLKDNRMVLNVDLGSGIMTTLSVGSLLDDNVWHDVVLSRIRRDIVLSVDRVVVQGRVKGEFSKLNLNRAFYVGGVPNIQEGIVVLQNYTGCVENLFLNNTNFVREVKYAYEGGHTFRFEKVHTLYSCPDPPITPVTFNTRDSYARLKGYEGIKQMNVSFFFRTYEDRGVLMFHEFTSKGYVKIYFEYGKVKVDIKTDDNPRAILDNYDEYFNDGRWHSLVLTISRNSLVLSIDYRPMSTTRLLSMTTGGVYYIGGSKLKDGFVGCMRLISVDGNYKLPSDWKPDEFHGDIVRDACRMTDRCNPNPCQHEGTCRQNSMEFICDCSHTGYAGAVCHTCKWHFCCLSLRFNSSKTHMILCLFDYSLESAVVPSLQKRSGCTTESQCYH